jgi:hypothetical protein
MSPDAQILGLPCMFRIDTQLVECATILVKRSGWRARNNEEGSGGCVRRRARFPRQEPARPT